MSKSLVVNIKRLVYYEVFIGRGSQWGNPFSHMKGTSAKYLVGSREEAISCYREWIKTQPNLLRNLRFLKGRILGCFCYPLPCHGNVLVEMSSEYEKWERVADELEAS